MSAACLSVAVAGCGGGTKAGTPSPSGSPSASAKTVVRDANADLVIWADDAKAKVLAPFVEKFGKENNIKAVVQAVNDNGRDSFVTATLAGKGPDIVVGAHDWVGKFVENGAISPIAMSSEQKATFFPTAIAAGTYNGQLYGVPYAIENIGLIRNTDLAPQVPATMEALVANGTALRKAGKVTQPMAMQVGQTGDPYHVYPFLSSAGGYIFGKKSNGDYDPNDLGLLGPGAAKAATKLAWLRDQGALKTSVGYQEALDLFTKGQTPYLVGGPWMVADIKKAHINFAVSPIPAFAGGGPARPFLGVQLFYISSKAKNATFAQEFALNYAGKPEVQEALYEAGQRPPAVKSVYEAAAAKDPNLKAWFEAGANGDPMPAIPAMNAVWGPLGVAEANIVAGKGDPATIMKQAGTEIRKAIDGG